MSDGFNACSFRKHRLLILLGWYESVRECIEDLTGVTIGLLEDRIIPRVRLLRKYAIEGFLSVHIECFLNRVTRAK